MGWGGGCWLLGLGLCWWGCCSCVGAWIGRGFIRKLVFGFVGGSGRSGEVEEVGGVGKWGKEE